LSGSVIPFPFFARFSAGLPANSEVQGFTVRYERRANAAAVSANETWIRLVSGAGAGVQLLGTTANSNLSNLSATDTYFSAGGSASMFGLATEDASAGRVNSIGWGVNIRYGTGTTLTSAIAQIDHMQLQVHYTVPSTEVAPVSAETGLEWGASWVTKNLLAGTAEWGHEHSGSWLIRNLIVSEYELGQEILSVSIAPPPLLVNGAETDFEASQSILDLNILVGAAEFDSEQASVGVVRNIVALSWEGEQEAETVSLQRDIFAASFESNNEVASISLDQPPLVVLSGEFENEQSVVSLILDVAAQSAEIGLEATNAGLIRDVFAQSIEMGRDYESVAVDSELNIGVMAGEYGAEYGSVGVTPTSTYSVSVDNFQFGGGYLLPVPANAWRSDRNSLPWRRRMRARHLYG